MREESLSLHGNMQDEPVAKVVHNPSLQLWQQVPCVQGSNAGQESKECKPAADATSEDGQEAESAGIQGSG